jgi:hypothetical protein
MKLLKELEKDNRDKILGLLLCAFALLLIISLISYDFESDHSKIRALFDGGDFGSIFSGLSNRGGIVGASISFLLYVIFGYFSILIPVALITWGINRFFGKPTIAIKKWTFILSAFMLAFMTLISLPSGGQGDSVLNVYAGGAIGHLIAKILLALFGTVFSYALAISLIITGLIFVIPSLLQRVTAYLVKIISDYPRTLYTAIKSRIKIRQFGKKESEIAPEEKGGFLSGIIRIKKKKTPREMEVKLPEEVEMGEVDSRLAVEESLEGDEFDSGNRIKKRIRPPRKKDGYQLPSEDLLYDPPAEARMPDKSDYRNTAEALRHTLLTFGVEIDSGEVSVFPGIGHTGGENPDRGSHTGDIGGGRGNTQQIFQKYLSERNTIIPPDERNGFGTAAGPGIDHQRGTLFGRPGFHAAPVDRRIHRLRQVGLSELPDQQFDI